MRNKEIADKLSSLMQLDVDAQHAYGQAIDEVDDVDICDHLTEYQNDHSRHAETLRGLITGLGEEPPEMTRSVKGFLIEGFTAIRSASGTTGALKAMETNEKLTNKKYREALDLDVPADIREILAEHYADEQRHLSYVQQALHAHAT